MVHEADLDAVGIFRTLNRQGVDFVVVGGYAVAAHGVIRATDDLDLVVDRSWENAGRLGRALEELEAQDATGAHAPLTAEALARREDRLFETSLGRIRLLSRVGIVPRYSELAPAVTVEVEGEHVRVATLDQIRAMKTGTGRLKDLVDLEELDELDDLR